MAASYQIIQNGHPTRNTFLSHGNGHLQEEINFRLNAKATSENSKVIETTPIDDLPRSQRTLLSNGRFSAPDIGKFIIQPIGSLQSLAVPCRHSGTPVSLLGFLLPGADSTRREAVAPFRNRQGKPPIYSTNFIFGARYFRQQRAHTCPGDQFHFSPPPPVIHIQRKIKKAAKMEISKQ